MRERDVDVLVRGIRREKGVAGVYPGEAQNWGDGTAVACVVEVHDVVGIFEREPFGGGEEMGRAEGRGAPDHSLVAAELEHGGYVGGGEVEGGSEQVETGGDGGGVVVYEGLIYELVYWWVMDRGEEGTFS